MVGTIINAGAVIVGSGIGLLLKKGLPEKYSTIFFQAIGLFTLILGIQMSLKLTEPLLVVLSLIVGSLTGELCKLEDRMTLLSEKLKKKFKRGNERFTEGFITAFLLFCMGSLAILGPVEEGLSGNLSDLLKTKSLIDGFSAILLASALGIGVMFSAIPIFLYQGGITILVMLIGKNIPEHYINEITVIGGVLLIGLALDLLNIKKLRIINMLPSLIYICLFLWISSLIA